MPYYPKKKKTMKKPKKRVPKRRPQSITKIVQKAITKQAEKKRDDINLASADFTMGQCAGNANAYYAGDITPNQITGSNPNQHTGNEISITSFYMQLQLRQMSSATAPAKIKFYMFRMKGTNVETPSGLVANLFEDNQFAGGGNVIVDANSSMNPDYLANYQLLKRWTCYLKPDQFSGQQMPLQRSIGMKFKKPLKLQWFTQTPGNSWSHGRIILVALSDSGNASLSTASTLTNIPVQTANTGQFLNFSVRWYYTDM